MAPTKPVHTNGDSVANPVDLTGVTSDRITKPGGTSKKNRAPKLTVPPAKTGTACLACRKGKARCVRVATCTRCLRAGVQCPSEADGPNAAAEVLLAGGGGKACERCRRLKAACVRKLGCARCEKRGVECVIGPVRA